MIFMQRINYTKSGMSSSTYDAGNQSLFEEFFFRDHTELTLDLDLELVIL